jgi:UDP-N-acetylmuramoyl-tripeptide--D-alanyl-D-alanine ligase
VIELDGDRIASATGAEVAHRGGAQMPDRAVVDSRQVQRGDLFVGLRGERTEGGRFAAQALTAGAWGAIVEPADAAALAVDQQGNAWVLAANDPLDALHRLANAWRRELAATVIGITGSVGKTSVKDICKAILPGRVHASPANFNTEVGMPLAILSAPGETEILVLEMAMRGGGQIAELRDIAQPEVATITNVGPVHLELLGTIEAIARAKAEILAGLGERGTAVLPVDLADLASGLEPAPRVLTFGPGGDVEARRHEVGDGATHALIVTPEGEADFSFPFSEAYNLTNALAAVAIGVAVGGDLAEMSGRAAGIVFSRLRGELVALPGQVQVINDCYNANPMSMRAALEHLSSLEASRRVAVLGEMKELGEDAVPLHEEVGRQARAGGVELLVGVGKLARAYGPDEWAPDAESGAALVGERLRPGDVVLVKGSRSVGLEAVTEALSGAPEGAP